MTNLMNQAPKESLSFNKILNACRYAWEGLAAAWRTEAAFRLEVILAAVLIPLALIFPIAAAGKALMIACVFLTLLAELVNSAIETVVDHITRERHPMAKRAKDIASAVVFISFVNLCAVWGVIILGAL